MNELFEDIIDYEEGNLNEEDTAKLFQKLIDTGLVWQLQGHYGRMAENLIMQGLCHAPENV
jgi:hypothetical protein